MRNNTLFEQLSGGWWTLPCGGLNLISDVAGVTVGHATMLDGTARTGVTAIRPHAGNLFTNKVEAGVAVLNGFGKSVGLVQLEELGQLETPILLSNTFAMPVCTTTLIKRAIDENLKIGRGLPTVNAVALECNDGQLNDIQAFHVTEELARVALDTTDVEFALGSIGAGTGMKSFGYAGGIGSASRLVEIGDDRFTLGALVLSNYGAQSEFRFCGKKLSANSDHTQSPDKGSIIIVLATDAPLDARQLKRVAKRSGAALGRTGSYLGNGSGDIAVAFSTSGPLGTRLDETLLDGLFLAAVEATEEAILSAMWHGVSRKGYDGLVLPSLYEKLQKRGDLT
ncbi:P1 family peptidase [Maritalea porphyrae]|uniref:P1 family peptidase n=1 Tax=Maritalea porphyrae TaxID=880732 RepID=UPI0022AF345A|nr:P1 family peptidase [Maritalea porphyrae]MCZ4273500.1 P1 family peptidase [Maritalea porphyrae]